MTTVYFPIPSAGPDGLIRVFCTACGWEHRLLKPVGFYCAACGHRHGHPGQPVPVGPPKPPAPAPAAPPVVRRETVTPTPPKARKPKAKTAPADVPEGLRAPTADDFEAFLTDVFPNGAAALPSLSIWAEWQNWCQAQDIFPRVLVWLCHRLRRTSRISAAGQAYGGRSVWRIAPAAEANA